MKTRKKRKKKKKKEEVWEEVDKNKWTDRQIVR